MRSPAVALAVVLSACGPKEWVLVRSVDEEQRPTAMKLSVVGEEGGGLWVETESQSYFSHSVSKVLYARMPRHQDEAADVVRKMVTKVDDEPPRVVAFASDDPGVVLMKGLMKSMMQGFYVEVTGSPKTETVTVPAGTFSDCAVVAASAKFGPMTVDSTSWFHPEVPLNGVVKGVSNKGDWTYELLDYGTSGAQSVLIEP